MVGRKMNGRGKPIMKIVLKERCKSKRLGIGIPVCLSPGRSRLRKQEKSTAWQLIGATNDYSVSAYADLTGERRQRTDAKNKGYRLWEAKMAVAAESRASLR